MECARCYLPCTLLWELSVEMGNAMRPRFCFFVCLTNWKVRASTDQGQMLAGTCVNMMQRFTLLRRSSCAICSLLEQFGCNFIGQNSKETSVSKPPKVLLWPPDRAGSASPPPTRHGCLGSWGFSGIERVGAIRWFVNVVSVVAVPGPAHVSSPSAVTGLRRPTSLQATCRGKRHRGGHPNGIPVGNEWKLSPSPASQLFLFFLHHLLSTPIITCLPDPALPVPQGSFG